MTAENRKRGPGARAAAGGLLLPGLLFPPAVYPGVALALAILFATLVALNWAAHRAWRALVKTEPPFGFYSVSAIVVALLLAMVGALLAPAFGPVYASMGTDLSAPALLLIQYGYGLAALVLLLPALWYALRASTRRERVFAGLLAGEVCLLALSLISLYAPIFQMTEAV